MPEQDWFAGIKEHVFEEGWPMKSEDARRLIAEVERLRRENAELQAQIDRRGQRAALADAWWPKGH